MATLQFEVDIKAPKEKVWSSLWDDSNYREWTTVFMEGSYAEGDWQEGSKMRFLTPDGSGMFSIVEKNVPYKEMVFRHLGEVKNWEEEVKEDWKDARENYKLEENNGTTKLTVAMDAMGSFEQYLKEVFPKGLSIIKNIAEGQTVEAG